MSSKSDTREFKWWLAINGASCAASSFALPVTLEVVPTPQLLLGFQTQDEQLKCQQFLLTAPVGAARKRMVAIQGDRSIMKIVPKGKPQPPVAQTIWYPTGSP